VEVAAVVVAAISRGLLCAFFVSLFLHILVSSFLPFFLSSPPRCFVSLFHQEPFYFLFDALRLVDALNSFDPHAPMT